MKEELQRAIQAMNSRKGDKEVGEALTYIDSQYNPEYIEPSNAKGYEFAASSKDRYDRSSAAAGMPTGRGSGLIEDERPIIPYPGGTRIKRPGEVLDDVGLNSIEGVSRIMGMFNVPSERYQDIARKMQEIRENAINRKLRFAEIYSSDYDTKE